MAVTNPGPAVKEEEDGVAVIQTPDMNFLGQIPQGNFDFFIDFHTPASWIRKIRRLTSKVIVYIFRIRSKPYSLPVGIAPVSTYLHHFPCFSSVF
jgi:hypothetical protein